MSNYDVFISSSSNDFSIAGEIYHFLCNHKLDVFFSEQSLPQYGCADYRDVIDKALEHTTHMVVVTSSRANVEGEWVKAEWGSFINERRSGRKKGNLVTILVGNLSPADLPMSLRQYEILPYNEVGLTKLLSYVGSGTAPVIPPVVKESAPKKKGGKLLAIGGAGSLLVLLFAFFGWNTLFKPSKSEPSGAPPSSQANLPGPPVSPQTNNASPAVELSPKPLAARGQSNQEIETERSESAKISTEQSHPVQPATASTVAPSAPVATATDSNRHDKPPQPATSNKPSIRNVGEQTAEKEQLATASSSTPKTIVAPPQPATPASSSLTAKSTATVFVDHPGINDQFVAKLLGQLHLGLSKQEQEATTTSAAKYVLRWAEKPRLVREGPNRNGEYTFSIFMIGEVYNPVNSQVVKSISVRDNQTGRNDQASSILDGLIAKSSSKILNSLAALE